MPKKSLGQHFLSDPNVLDRIVAFSRVGESDTVVEIGPGRGALTRVLARRALRVIAIEVDDDLIGPLGSSLPANATVVSADALEIDFLEIAPAGFHIVANLPYNIATPLVERFIAARTAIATVTIMLQKEVADRILARPGTREYGPLTVGVQLVADVERGFVLKPGAFSPPPKVDSRVIRLDWKPGSEPEESFLAFVRGVFSQRRKTLANNLAAMMPELDRGTIVRAIQQTGHPEAVRAERLAIGEFERLYAALRLRPVDRIGRPRPYNGDS